MEDLKYWVWLSRIEYMNKLKLDKLLKEYKTIQNIWNINNKKDILKLGISEEVSEKIVSKKYKENLYKYLEYMQKNNIELVTITNKYYPQNLKEIYDPPIMLYVKGNKKILNDVAVAIVGCRECSKYGENIAKKLAYNLSKANINIISGLARGIDTYSHIGTLYAKGKTIAVIGSGLDIVYPAENRMLYNKIIETGGAVISEYIVGTKPEARHFPARNRIISGISNGVIVVEAKEKSGTLITVDFALEQGKNVYVIPGNITNPNSFGTNELAKQGAKIVTKLEDVLEDFGEYIN